MRITAVNGGNPQFLHLYPLEVLMERARYPGPTRQERLRGREAFDAVFREGSGFRSGQLLLKYLVEPGGESGIRVAFVIRRGAGGAVRRNRLRRLMREAYRLQRRGFEETAQEISLNLVVMWSGSPDQAQRPRFDLIFAQMETALRRLAKKLSRNDERADGH